MKLTLNTEDLRAGISTVTAALASKSDAAYSRIYEFIRAEAFDNKLTLCCCNFSVQIETTVAASVSEPGAVMFPGKLLSDLVRVLPSDKQETTLEGNTDTVRVTSGHVDLRLQTVDPDGFLSMAVSSVTHKIRINEGKLKAMITRTAPMALEDPSRPILGGVLMECEDDSLTMVALDGLKLAKRTENIEKISGDDPAEFVVNAKMLMSAARVMNDEGTAEVEFSKQSIMIKTDDKVMILRTIEGQFVRYRGMLPKSHDSSVRLNRDVLCKAIERAYLIAKDDKNNLIKLSFEEDTLTMSVNNEVGKVHDVMDVTLSGTPILTAFNAKYLLDIIKSIDEEEIMMEMTVKPGPCVIRPTDGNGYYYLVLPVRLV